MDTPELPEALKAIHVNDEEVKRKEKQALHKQLERFDENVKHAILLRMEKDEKTEFYRRLETLTDRIKVYKNVSPILTIDFLFKATIVRNLKPSHVNSVFQ
jgi:hypothetical protein